MELNLNEAKDVILHFIQTNKHLQDKGQNPLAVELIGESGIGKTSIVKQVAKELDVPFVKLNLAQTEDLGDLVGFPIIEFKLIKEDNPEDYLWVSSGLISEYTFGNLRDLGYRATYEKRTTYCPPDWIQGKGEEGILLLDDYTRANPNFINATMELIDNHQYLSWKLPKGWTIILTSNPDDGEYMVSSLDQAQQTRYLSFKVEFDIKCWAEWAEKEDLDERCINFLLLNKELAEMGNINSRIITHFFRAISGLEDFSSFQSLRLIELIGEASVKTEFTQLFIQFINKNLDKIPSIENILYEEDETKLINYLKGLLFKDDQDFPSAEIVSLIATRIENYFKVKCYKNNLKVKDGKLLEKRLELLLDNNMLTEDILYSLVRNLYQLRPSNPKSNSGYTCFENLTANEKLNKAINN